MPAIEFTPGVTYYWRVRAVNQAGASEWSEAEFTPLLIRDAKHNGKIAFGGTDNQGRSDGSVWIVNPDGTSLYALPIDILNPNDFATAGYGFADFSPNGQHLAFVRKHLGANKAELVLRDMDSGEIEILIDNFTGMIGRPNSRPFDWSPNSTQIAFGNAEGIWTIEVDTGDLRLLIPSFSDLPLVDPQWSPSGTYIAFRIGTYFEGVGEFATAHIDGSNLTTWGDTIVGDFDWSPDGTLIVFDNNSHTPFELTTISVAGTDGSNPQIIINDSQLITWSPHWSPNGKNIAFIGDGAIWRVDVDGSNLSKLGGDIFQLSSWSPDSQKVLGISSYGLIQIVSQDQSQSPIIIGEGYDATWQELDSPILLTPNELTVGRQASVFVIRGDTLNVRGGPGTGYAILERLDLGTIVDILDGPQDAEGYTWWYLQTPSGVKGWAVESADGIQTLSPLSP